ncbi:MAG: hypothetical protein ACM3X9_14365 [Bacillota bacterium]
MSHSPSPINPIIISWYFDETLKKPVKKFWYETRIQRTRGLRAAPDVPVKAAAAKFR